MSQPKLIITPWGENGLKNDIPVIRTEGLNQELATYSEGFPSITMTPISVGGKPPSGRDMNGILYELSSHIAYMNRGGHYKFDQAYCEAINGYPVGAILINDTETALYISKIDHNKTNFNIESNGNWEVIADTKLKSDLTKIINTKANINSPSFTGTPTAPTPSQTVSNAQVATTEFVKEAIAALVGSAPATLDTLAEIAQALGSDGNLKATLLAEIGKKANQTDFTTLKNLLIGIPFPYPLSAVPSGCLAFNGQSFNESTYPILAQKYPSGVLPDLRGEFIRFWDNGRGVDSGRALLSAQGDAIRNITGSILLRPTANINNENTKTGDAKGVFILSDNTGGGAWNPISVGARNTFQANDYSFDASRQVPTASENRPRNIAFQAICLAA